MKSVSNKEAIPLSERDFQVLDALDRHEITSQRQLAQNVGISLGQVNYVLKSLLDKGLVKLGNFKKNPRKMVSYAYLLTPRGIEEKSRLAVRFVINLLKEYDSLRQIFTEKLTTIHKNGHKRIIIAGPKIIREFLMTIINEDHRETTVIGQCGNWKDLTEYRSDDFDVALLFDDSERSRKEIGNSTGIPRQKIMTL